MAKFRLHKKYVKINIISLNLALNLLVEAILVLKSLDKCYDVSIFWSGEFSYYKFNDSTKAIIVKGLTTENQEKFIYAINSWFNSYRGAISSDELIVKYFYLCLTKPYNSSLSELYDGVYEKLIYELDLWELIFSHSDIIVFNESDINNYFINRFRLFKLVTKAVIFNKMLIIKFLENDSVEIINPSNFFNLRSYKFVVLNKLFNNYN